MIANQLQHRPFTLHGWAWTHIMHAITMLNFIALACSCTWMYAWICKVVVNTCTGTGVFAIDTYLHVPR